MEQESGWQMLGFAGGGASLCKQKELEVCMNDYYATLKIQQGRLKAAMLEMGIHTVAELSKRSGITQGQIGKLINFKRSPRTVTGEWKKSTLAICRVLGYEPSELFPEHLDHEIPTNRIAAYVEQAQISGGRAQHLLPGDECQNAELTETIDEVLGTLTERERSVLKDRFWKGKTLREVGKDYDIEGQRVSQIERHALRKLRHPSRLVKLKEVY